jgi:hypothetical protein
MQITAKECVRYSRCDQPEYSVKNTPITHATVTLVINVVCTGIAFHYVWMNVTEVLTDGENVQMLVYMCAFNTT